MSDDLPPLHKLAHDLLHETLHGAPPVETTMRLAEGILALIDRCERAERERDSEFIQANEWLAQHHDAAKERDTLRAKVGELEAHLRRVLDVERESAVRAGLSGCTCMTKSRADERAYETGTCPHQLADTALRSPK